MNGSESRASIVHGVKGEGVEKEVLVGKRKAGVETAESIENEFIGPTSHARVQSVSESWCGDKYNETLTTLLLQTRVPLHLSPDPPPTNPSLPLESQHESSIAPRCSKCPSPHLRVGIVNSWVDAHTFSSHLSHLVVLFACYTLRDAPATLPMHIQVLGCSRVSGRLARLVPWLPWLSPSNMDSVGSVCC